MDGFQLECERKRAGLTQQTMADNLGISLAAYGRKERGESEFTLAEIRKIVSILKLDDSRALAIFFAEEVS